MINNIIAQDAARICERVNFAALRDKTVLITGASGLLGTYFLATLGHLRAAGMAMKVIAQVRSEPAPHTAEIIQRGGFQLAQADVADQRECSSLPEADVVIHSACYAQPLVFMANPAATIRVNTTATATLLDKLRAGGSLLFVSSAEVYSGLKQALVNESDIGTTTPLHPRSSYIEGKRCGEAICNAYRNNGIRAVSARLAFTYGPGTRQHDKRAINSFIEMALCQGRIELMDAGEAIRTCCYVSDAVELMWQAGLHGTQPVYNIGGHSLVTTGELAKLVGGITGASVVFPATQAGVAGAPEYVRLDVSRAESEFQKTTYVSLEDGVRATIEWQRGLYGR
jgi:nucleoside-diphosphate-sugar epimerase